MFTWHSTGVTAHMSQHTTHWQVREGEPHTHCVSCRMLATCKHPVLIACLHTERVARGLPPQLRVTAQRIHKPCCIK